jgi:L-ascorbate metabolism protein UlaG (beta-lactamase superfamily)
VAAGARETGDESTVHTSNPFGAPVHYGALERLTAERHRSDGGVIAGGAQFDGSRRPCHPPDTVATAGRRVRGGRVSDRVRYLGHATVLIEIADRRVLTDPVLTGRVAFIRRMSARPPAFSSQPDVVLISHGHQDHLHRASLSMVPADVPIIVPIGLGALVRRWGFHRVEELAVHGATTVGGVSITAVPAVHSGFRPPSGPRAEAIGFVVGGNGRAVYFAGDTDLYPEMAEIGREGLDVALVPVWGWGPRLGPGHLDPDRAAEAVRLLSPAVAIPIHWGTLWPMAMYWRRHHLTEPPLRFAEAVATLDVPTRVVVLEPGDAHELGATAGAA